MKWVFHAGRCKFSVQTKQASFIINYYTIINVNFVYWPLPCSAATLTIFPPLLLVFSTDKAVLIPWEAFPSPNSVTRQFFEVKVCYSVYVHD